MSSIDVVVDGTVRQRWDDGARVVTFWDVSGMQILSRPYTSDENALADQRAADATAAANYSTLVTKAHNAITANTNFLALTSPTNADVLAQVRLLTREATALIRIAIHELGTTDGT